MNVRCLPLGLCLIAVGAQAADMTGEEVYRQTCNSCHGKGRYEAPRFGDKKRWKKLIDKGLDELVPNALKGVRNMPAKGDNPDYSDLEVARAVVYMANVGGGQFAAPTAAQVENWRRKADR